MFNIFSEDISTRRQKEPWHNPLTCLLSLMCHRGGSVLARAASTEDQKATVHAEGWLDASCRYLETKHDLVLLVYKKGQLKSINCNFIFLGYCFNTKENSNAEKYNCAHSIFKMEVVLACKQQSGGYLLVKSSLQMKVQRMFTEKRSYPLQKWNRCILNTNLLTVYNDIFFCIQCRFYRYLCFVHFEHFSL